MFVTELRGDAGISVRRIVWVTTDCCFTGDIGLTVTGVLVKLNKRIIVIVIIICYSSKLFDIQRTVHRDIFLLWNSFTIVTFLYNIDFYLQHLLQFNYNVHVYLH